MRGITFTLNLIGALALATAAAPIRAQTNAPPNLWVGGVHRGDLYLPLQLLLRTADGRIEGTADSRRLRLRASRVLGTIARDGSVALSLDSTLTLSGRFSGDTLVARGLIERDSVRVALVHVQRSDPAADPAVAGLYEVGPGRYLSVGRPPEGAFLVMADYSTGDYRTLYPALEGGFVTGRSFSIPEQIESRLSFGADGVVIRRGAETLRGRRMRFAQDTIRFTSGDAVLTGVLTRPQTAGRHPVVVFVHGSGAVGRNAFFAIPDLLPAHGIATFAYDKRGTGLSTGVHADRVDGARFELLANDVVAAVEAMRTKPGIDGDRVALFGISQAGWIVPIAATRTRLSFTALVSGPSVSLGEESAFSQLTGDDFGRGSDTPMPEIERVIDTIPPSSFDPRPFIERLRAPGLWIFGRRDRSVPALKSATVLADIAKRTGTDFTVVMYPEGQHVMWESVTGTQLEIPYTRRFVPHYFDDLISYMRAQFRLGSASTMRP